MPSARPNACRCCTIADWRRWRQPRTRSPGLARPFGVPCGTRQQRIAAASLEMNRALLAQTRLHAPFAGIVAEINGEVGEYVTPSPPGIPMPPAVDLIDYSCLYVRAPIDEVDAGRLQTGLRARITLDAFGGRHFEGRLDQHSASCARSKSRRARSTSTCCSANPQTANTCWSVTAPISTCARNASRRDSHPDRSADGQRYGLAIRRIPWTHLARFRAHRHP